MARQTIGGWRAVLHAPVPLLGFLAGSSVSDLGNGFFRLALPWLVYNLTHSATAMGGLAAVQYVPMLLNPWAGALADRYGPRTTILWSSLIQMVLVLLVPLASTTGTLSLALVYAVTLALATGSLVTQSATSVLVKRHTPISARVGVNALVALLFNVSWYVSPGLAGFVIGQAGVNAALLLDGASFIAVLIPVLFIAQEPSLGAGARLDMKRSWRTFRSAKGLLPITVAFAIWNLTWGGVFALEVFFFRNSLHLSAMLVGIIGTLGGTFPMLLGLFGPWLVQRIRVGWLMALTLATSGLGMAALGYTRGWAEAAAAVNVMDGAIAPVLIVQSTVAQETIPEEIFGQVFSISWAAAGGALPAGGLLAGVLAPLVGVPATMALLGGVAVLGGSMSLGWLRGVSVGNTRQGEGSIEYAPEISSSDQRSP
ncbi:MAG: MFS transporter [Thermaerobacter sp.]|nr:MFS transporter [Thermaerobacter sp.]